MVRDMLLAMALVATPAIAAEDPSRIRVVGHGKVSTDPDVASLSFAIRGEGTSADDAARALSRKRAAIAEGLAGLLGPKAVLRTGTLSMSDVRDRACFGPDGDDDRPKLSSGACTVRGYVAVMEGSLRISPVKEAGTALGLVGRLGATNPRLDGFSIADRGAAQQRAPGGRDPRRPRPRRRDRDRRGRAARPPDQRRESGCAIGRAGDRRHRDAQPRRLRPRPGRDRHHTRAGRHHCDADCQLRDRTLGSGPIDVMAAI